VLLLVAERSLAQASYTIELAERWWHDHARQVITDAGGTTVTKRADGSFVEERRTPDGTTRTLRLHQQDGTILSIEADLTRGMKSTVRLTAAEFEEMTTHWPTAASRCAQSRDGRSARPAFKQSTRDETVEGVRAVRFESQNSDFVHTIWLAPSLDCSMVRAELYSPMAVPSAKTQTSTARRIVAGRADDSLFALPENLKEVPPSVRLGHLAEHAGAERARPHAHEEELAERLKAEFAALDRFYHAHRP